MESKYIAAFVGAVRNVFKTMLKTDVSFARPFRKGSGTQSSGVSGIIGFTGNVRGSIVVCFPLDVASALIECFTGAVIAPSDPDFADAIGELVNMIAGGAKTQFNEGAVAIGCPSVVIGKEHQVYLRKDDPVVVVPCTCGHGAFAIEIALKSQRSQEAAPREAAGSVA